MKKFFKLRIESESFGGRVLNVEKSPLINIELVESADKKERLVQLSSGTVLRLAPNDEYFDYKEFWEVIEEGNNPFGRDRESEMCDIIDAGRWRKFLKFMFRDSDRMVRTVGQSPDITYRNAVELTREIDYLISKENAAMADAYGNADFDKEGNNPVKRSIYRSISGNYLSN